jgi:hypothetical protein
MSLARPRLRQAADRLAIAASGGCRGQDDIHRVIVLGASPRRGLDAVLVIASIY